MLQAAPVVDYVMSIYQSTDKLNVDTALSEKVENLIDIIKIRVNTKGVRYTCSSLRDEMWDLRWELLSQQKNLDEIFTLIHEVTTENISMASYLQTSIEKTKADCLVLYAKVVTPISDTVKKDASTFSTQDFITGKNLYGSLKLLASTTPSTEIKTPLSWIENSLDFECCLVLCALISSEDLNVDAAIKSDIEQNLKTSIVNFGFYSALMQVWHPKEEDETAYVRNVKILLADYELSNNNCGTYLRGDFEKAFAA